MKIFIPVFITLLFSGCVAGKPDRSAGEHKTVWEYENEKAVRIFKEEYKSRQYPTYGGYVSTVFDSGHYVFYFGTRKIVIDNADFIPVFERGLLYPEIFGLRDNVLHIGFDRVADSRQPKHGRRFMMRVHLEGSSSSVVYVVEFMNKDARPGDGLKTFLESAGMTFFREGWVIM